MTKQYKGYIGTYTKGDSEGIYSFTLDTDSAKIIDVKLAAEVDNPTYLTISKDNRSLYSVVKEGASGGVAAFTIENTDLIPVNQQVLEGSPPCHVSVSEQNSTVLSANYHKGSVEAYTVEEGGKINPPSAIVFHHGFGPDERQEKAHTHYAAFTPDERFVVAVDLGTDQVITYRLQDGALEQQSIFTVKPGSGPRHIEFHPSNQKIAYLMTEFSSEVVVLHLSEDGVFTELQTISTLPSDFLENNQGSAIHISSDGKFVYAANRGHNSIALFSVNPNNRKLTFVEHTSTYGNWPRDFVLDPSEKFLVASNQNSSNIVLYARDNENGKLTMLQSDIVVPDPVCVKFLHY